MQDERSKQGWKYILRSNASKRGQKMMSRQKYFTVYWNPHSADFTQPCCSIHFLMGGEGTNKVKGTGVFFFIDSFYIQRYCTETYFVKHKCTQLFKIKTMCICDIELYKRTDSICLWCPVPAIWYVPGCYVYKAHTKLSHNSSWQVMWAVSQTTYCSLNDVHSTSSGVLFWLLHWQIIYYGNMRFGTEAEFMQRMVVVHKQVQASACSLHCRLCGFELLPFPKAKL